MPKMPSAVELGFIFRGSDTDLSEGTRLGKSSRGVVAGDDSSENGETGVSSSSSPPLTTSSGLAGIKSEELIAMAG